MSGISGIPGGVGDKDLENKMFKILDSLCHLILKQYFNTRYNISFLTPNVLVLKFIIVFLRHTLTLKQPEMIKTLNVKYLSLSKCITFELNIDNKVCHFVHPYRSTSLTQDEYQMLTSNLK